MRIVDKPEPYAVEKMVISNTEKILTRAAEIDHMAWAYPLRERLQKRRNQSYAQARDEFILSVRDTLP
jgi:hypothetical protein